MTQTSSSPGRLINRVALGLVVVLTAWAAVASSISSSRSNEALDTVQRVAFCNTTILSRALNVLNARSVYSTAQATANLELQRAQADLLRKSVSGEQVTPAEGAAALKRYFDALTEFVTAAEAAKATAVDEPYPNERDIAKCISSKEGKARP